MEGYNDLCGKICEQCKGKLPGFIFHILDKSNLEIYDDTLNIHCENPLYFELLQTGEVAEKIKEIIEKITGRKYVVTFSAKWWW